MADQYPAVQPDSASPLFKAADYAADMVSRGFGHSVNEQAAVIFRRPDGQLVYSTVAPQTLHDQFALRAQMPRGYQIAGIVHNHLGGDWQGQQFSPEDLATASRMNVPSYIRFTQNNSIRKFTPGKTQTSTMGDKLNQKKIAYGDPVDAYQDPPPSPLQVAASSVSDPSTGALSAVNSQQGNSDAQVTDSVR